MSLTNDQLQNMLRNKIFNGKLSEYVKVNLKGKPYIYFNSNIIQFSCGDNMMHISGFCPALKISDEEIAEALMFCNECNCLGRFCSVYLNDDSIVTASDFDLEDTTESYICQRLELSIERIFDVLDKAFDKFFRP